VSFDGENAESDMKRILLTGAAGRIGTSLRNSLGHTYHFRCLDTEPVGNETDSVVASLMDFEHLSEAMKDMDSVVHLAANPGLDQPWAEVYAAGIGGTYNVLEAARKAGIQKVIYASSTAVLGWSEMQKGKPVSPDMPVNPQTLYGIGKATGELLARYFAEAYGMSIICLRIGSFFLEPPVPQGSRDDFLRAWCSPEDLAQLVQRCLETDGLGFQVFYGVSNNRRRVWDIRNARKLVRYQPVSDAEDWVRPPKQKNKRVGLTNVHFLLMRAALEDSPEALESWNRWADVVDLEKAHLDTLSYRLLPLVFFNLAHQNVDHPFMAKLRGVYRRAWLENQLSLQQVIPFITQLRDRGIATLLLDDLTSILRLYEGQGLRRLYSLDLLVQPADLPNLLGFFEDQKIWPKISYAKRFLAVETPLEVWPPFDMPLTVAWRVHPSVTTYEQAAEAWQRADSAMLGDCPVYTLDQESHFLRSCLRAVGGRPEAAFFAMVDVAWMLKNKPDEIEWGRVVKLARGNSQALPVIDCLEEIATTLRLPYVNKLLTQMRALPIGWTDHLEHRWVYSNRPYPGLMIRIGRRLLLYRRSPKIPGRLGLLRYLQYAWGGARMRSLLRLVLRHLREPEKRLGA
jgi:uronate dehydrogenase